MSLCGLSIAGGYRFTWFLDVFENDSARILFLDAGDQGIAVRVIPLAEVSRLEWSQYEHRQNIENLLNRESVPVLIGSGNTEMFLKPPVTRIYERRLSGLKPFGARVCGDHRRVISARHLSKHEIDRETYMADYRLSPDQLIAKDVLQLQSSRPGYHPYGKSDWVRALKAIYKKTGNVFAGYLQKNYPHIYVQGIWIYGDWDKALSAAGFNPEGKRQRHRWSDDKVLKGISRLRAKRLPLYAKYVMKTHAGLFKAGQREFGTWSKALLSAGIPKIQTQGKGGLSILRALRDIRESHPKKEISKALKLQAEHYFGTLRTTIAQSKTDLRVAKGWSIPIILALLSQMHRRGEDLTYGNALRSCSPCVYDAVGHVARNDGARDAGRGATEKGIDISRGPAI